jgi:hypothetical protein
VSVLLHLDLLSDPAHRLPAKDDGGPFSDPILFSWFLRWIPHAIAHGQNPLFTNDLFYPHGINLAWNTAVPALAIVMWPVTAVAGANVSFNLLMVAAPALSGWTFRWWLLRWVRPGVASLGGLVFAFGPFLSGQGLAHLHLVFVPLVPVILRLLEDALWRRPRPAIRTGVLLGAAVALQCYIGEEMLLLTATGALAALVWFAVQRPRAVWAAARPAVQPLAIGVGVFVALTLPVLLAQFLGSQRVSRIGAGPNYRDIPGDVVQPTSRFLLGPHTDTRLLVRGETSIEVTSYLGWPLLVLIVVVIARRWRDLPTRVAALVGLTGFVFSLGERYAGDAHQPLPYALMAHLPGFDSVIRPRFSLITLVAVIWIVATELDRLWTRPRHAERIIGIGLVAASLIPLIPQDYQASHVTVPRFFRSSAVKVLPAGAPVLVLPVPGPASDDRAMAWQAADAFRFKLYSGYAVHPRADKVGAIQPTRTPLYVWAEAVGWGEDPPTAARAAALAELHRIGIRYVVVPDGLPQSAELTVRTSELLGTAPRQVSDVWLWAT